MRKRKQFISILLALAMILTFMPAMAWATGEYTSLPPADENGIINLGGNTYTLTSPYILSDGAVTIKDGTIESSVVDLFQANGATITFGEGLQVNGSDSLIYAYNGGKIVIDGATLKSTNSDNTVAYIKGTDSSLVMNSGYLSHCGKNHVTLSVDEGATAVINGGIIDSDSSTTIVAKNEDSSGNGSQITIKGGSISTTANYVAGYAINGAKIIVDGGTISSNAWCALSAIRYGTPKGGEIEVNGGTIDKAVGAYEGADSKVTINGGTIGAGGDNWGIYVNNGATVNVTGGNVNGYAQNQGAESTLYIRGGTFSKPIYSKATIPEGTVQAKIDKTSTEIAAPTSYAVGETAIKNAASDADEGDTIQITKGSISLETKATVENNTGDENANVKVNGITVPDTSGESVEKVKVTFDQNYVDGSITSLTIVKNSKITKPTDPTRSGYSFKGWFAATGETVSDTAYDFNTAVTADLILKAKWEVIPAPAPTPDPVKDVVDAINALPANPATDAEKAQVAAARKAYDALTADQKKDERLTDAVVKKLTDAEEAIKSGEAHKAAGEVSKAIADIPEDPANSTKEQVAAARAAYEALDAAAKQLITESELSKLENAEYYWASTDAKAQKVTLKSVKAKKGQKALAKWKKNEAASGYQLVYSTSKKFTKKTTKKVTIKSYKTIKKTVKKLKKGKKYYFRLRTFNTVYNPATGKDQKIYGKWSKVKNIKAK